jgi:hypothetical protein
MKYFWSKQSLFVKTFLILVSVVIFGDVLLYFLPALSTFPEFYCQYNLKVSVLHKCSFSEYMHSPESKIRLFLSLYLFVLSLPLITLAALILRKVGKKMQK